MLAMALFSLFKRRDRAAAAAPTDLAPADQVREARQRARRRLMGAVLLLGIGILGFPLLFETQPRPIPVDIVIDIPRKDQVAPLVAPGAKPDAVITERAAEAGKEVPPAAAKPAAPTVVANGGKTSTPDKGSDTGKVADADNPVATAPGTPHKPSVTDKTAPPARSDVDAARALAALEGRPSTKPDTGDSTTGGERFIVQVGAFSDPAGAREARMKVERLGIKTYLQVVEVGGEKRTRVRMGPYASRDEADRAAAKVKAAGLTVVILAL